MFPAGVLEIGSSCMCLFFEVHLYLASPKTVQLTLLSNPKIVVKRKFTVSVQWIVGNFSYLGHVSLLRLVHQHICLYPGPCRCQQCVRSCGSFFVHTRASSLFSSFRCLRVRGQLVFLVHHRT